MAETYKIGIDVGGTFTDLFLWASGGGVETFKVLSTPSDPSEGVLNGLARIADAKGLEASEFAARTTTIVHGTTVTTNAVLTRKGAATGLITTEGVRDALEMRRGIREEQYDNRYLNVKPLVPRHRRLAVKGRLDAAGRELTPLDLGSVRAAAEALAKEQVEAVAVCFMNAFADASHEEAAKATIREVLPDAFLSVSTEILPTIRFYNRVSTTVLNAYVGPVLERYLASLTGKLAEVGFSGVLLIMQSSGGVASPEATARRPAMTLLSGPAGAPRAARAFTSVHGDESCLVVDMGGTSFDASLVRDGDAELKSEGEIDRLRIALPMLEIVTIGAGGGSVGWIDKGGLLRMGPESAGADPGPACYGRGGVRPTCTDADLLLGYLDPAYFAGGKLPLQVDLARKVVQEQIAEPMGTDIDEAAAGMYRVINTNMAHGVREITIKRGLDPREYPLVVAGGAGPLHACMIARELEIPRVVVPATASVLCATGMLLSDLQHDFVRSCVRRLEDLAPGHLAHLLADLAAEGEAMLQAEGVEAERIEHVLALDLRYLKQYHEVTVPIARELVQQNDTAAIAAAFHAEHDRLYGYDQSGDGVPIEVISVRLRSVGRTEKPDLARSTVGTSVPSASLKGTRRAFVPEAGEFVQVPIYDGHSLGSGAELTGPALIERTDTTIFVSGDFRARIDDYGTCLMEAING